MRVGKAESGKQLCRRLQGRRRSKRMERWKGKKKEISSEGETTPLL